MKKLIYWATIVLLVQACKKSDDELTYSVDTAAESAQQVGDVTASVDESGGSTSGAISSINELESYKRSYARITGENVNQVSAMNLIVPQVQAAACNTVAFDVCGTAGAGKRVRDFASCTVGTSGTMTGNVTLTFAGTGAGTCTMPANADSVSRVPNFSITGLRGATFSVSAPTTGQVMTRTAPNVYSFANNGVRRTFTTPKGSTILDVTTTTGSPITVNATAGGGLRNGRTMTGGSLVVTNNLTADACTLTPTGVTWTTGCNCPTAGNWSGTCAPSGNTFAVTYGTTCGSVTVSSSGEADKVVTLDRCSQ